MARIDREELRALVRQALKEALGAGPAPAPAAPPPATVSGSELTRVVLRAVAEGRRAEVNVALRTREDADRFARDIAEASSDPAVKAAILAGSVGFLPVGAPSAAVTVPQPKVSDATYEMQSGVLSETRLVEIARTHRRITLGSAAVLTPLARDKAREMKIELTRQKP